jgi:hypothetical protein
MLRLLFSLCFILSGLTSCDNREQKLRKQEQELAQKEQELILKERELELREQQLQKVNDSTGTNSATIASFPKAAVTGSWTVKMTCIETDCEGSAIGDIKNEHWKISFENNTILAKATVNNKLVRVYSGEPQGRLIELTAEQNATETSNEAKMFVKLKLLSPEKMEGKREIFREGCRIIYSLELNKQ